MSSIAKNKTELMEMIEASHSKLRAEFSDISEELANKKTMDGHVKDAKMSTHNLLAYLVGWGELVLKWENMYVYENKLPDVPEVGYKWGDLGKLAQKFYKDYEKDDFKTLLKKNDDVVTKILKMIESKSNEELYEVDWYKKYTLGRMIAFNTSAPYKNAYGRIRKWKKEEGIL